MTTSYPSGWYDDPDDPSQLRYWDGVVWTPHVVPKHAPSLSDSHLGEVKPWQPDARPATPDQRSWPTRGQWPSARPTTADGVALSGWWRRVGAFLIDAILVNAVVMLLGWSWLSESSQAVSQWWEAAATAAAGGQPVPAIPGDVVGQLGTLSVTVALIHAVYDTVALVRWGTSLGRMATGISVRLTTRPGSLPADVAVRRTAVKFLGDVAAPLPLLGFLAGIFMIVDRLWPLRDPGRQSIHDKMATTQVVIGRPERHQDPAR